jgi:hypothetical protein
MQDGVPILDGVEPAWWRDTIAHLVPIDRMLAAYVAGSARWDRVIGLLRLRGIPVLLGLTETFLVGVRFSQPGDRNILHLESWSVRRDRVSEVRRTSEAWLDDAGQFAAPARYSATITLDVPLGELGPEITLPLQPNEDYGGRFEMSEPRAKRFVEVLTGIAEP